MHEVGGGEGIAIAPLGIGAEMEGVGQAVGRDVPALGDAWFGFSVLANAAQSLKQRGRNSHADLIGDDGGIDALGLGTVDEDEVGALHPAGAGCRNDQQQGAERKTDHARV